MYYELIGTQKIDYINRSGSRIVGTRLYAVFDDDSGCVDGKGCEVFYLSGNCVVPLEVGMKFEPVYNKFGKVQYINRVGDV